MYLEYIQYVERYGNRIEGIKQNVVSCMERKIGHLKSTILTMFEKASTEKSYSTVVIENSSNPINVSRATDEGFCNSLTSGNVSDPSQTHVKTVFHRENLLSATRDDPPAQHSPVRITNRLPVQPAQSSSGSQKKPIRNQRPQESTRQRQPNKTLLIGDFILYPINTKGLVRGIHKHARSGATINDIINYIGMYDLAAFRNIIISVGRNYSFRKTDAELFKEKYDQLISLIKTSSPQCTLFVCKVAPRGDTDITNVNSSIERLALHWQKHDMMCTISKEKTGYQLNDTFRRMGYISRDLE